MDPVSIPMSDVAEDEVGVLNHMEERRQLAARLEDPEFKKRYIEEQEQAALEKLVAAYEGAKIAEANPPAPAPAPKPAAAPRVPRILTQEQIDNIRPDPPLDNLNEALGGSGVTIMHVEHLTINIVQRS